MLNGIDTYWEYVSDRMTTVVNPDRQMIGVMDAMDWPPKNVVPEAFYLLVLGERPVTNKSFWSPTITTVVHTVQWTWLIIGTDLTQGKVGRSRGDRYRTNMIMRDELTHATYPWYAQKNEYSVVGNTPSGLALKATPVEPTEDIWWTPLTFLNRIDRDTGVVYGAATVQITDMGKPTLV
jgi:hypothetical protein